MAGVLCRCCLPRELFSTPACRHRGRGRAPREFSFRALDTATHGFDDSLGVGGSGSVFRGQLPNGQQIAVKCIPIDRDTGQMEFQSEVTILSSVAHPNIVTLIGYCREQGRRIVVYEYVANRTLYHHLHATTGRNMSLPWLTRLQIAAGVSAALDHLHRLNPPVIHRDVKPANILLDLQLMPKLADFGIARHGPEVDTIPAGTLGYVDPLCLMTHTAKCESDVYSFGVLLLELVSGRKPIDPERSEEERDLLSWARPLLDNKIYDTLVDPNLVSDLVSTEFPRQLLVLADCCMSDTRPRPTMRTVHRTVTSIMELSTILDQVAHDSASSSANPALHSWFQVGIYGAVLTVICLLVGLLIMWWVY